MTNKDIEDMKNNIDELAESLKMAQEKICELANVNMKLQVERNDYKSKAERLEVERMEVKRNEFYDFLPTEPIEVAEQLINATYTRKKGDMEKALHKAFGNNADTVTERVYSALELRQIAGHLLVYCNHNEEADNE